jgi:hypothetical protein
VQSQSEGSSKLVYFCCVEKKLLLFAEPIFFVKMLLLILSRNVTWSNYNCDIAMADSTRYDSDRETVTWSIIVLEGKICSK